MGTKIKAILFLPLLFLWILIKPLMVICQWIYRKKEPIGAAGQWFAGLMMAVGIAAEIVYKADLYLIIITIGSFTGYVFTKLRHHSGGNGIRRN